MMFTINTIIYTITICDRVNPYFSIIQNVY